MSPKIMFLGYCVLTPLSAITTGLNIAQENYGMGVVLAVFTWLNYRIHIFWYNRMKDAEARKRKTK